MVLVLVVLIIVMVIIIIIIIVIIIVVIVIYSRQISLMPKKKKKLTRRHFLRLTLVLKTVSLWVDRHFLGPLNSGKVYAPIDKSATVDPVELHTILLLLGKTLAMSKQYVKALNVFEQV